MDHKGIWTYLQDHKGIWTSEPLTALQQKHSPVILINGLLLSMFWFQPMAIYEIVGQGFNRNALHTTISRLFPELM